MADKKGKPKYDVVVKKYDGEVKGRCMKCGENGRKMVNVSLVKMHKNGVIASKGECKKCGTGMFKMGDPR